MEIILVIFVRTSLNVLIPIVWKSPQRVDCPIEAVIESTELLIYSTLDSPSDRGKNIIGSKYFDSEGKRINRENIEADESMKKDPIWTSVRTSRTTRVDMEGYIATMDSQTEELISQLKVHMASGEKASSNGYEFRQSCCKITF